MIRTSLTHPLAIAELPVGERGGAIGVTFAPMKSSEGTPNSSSRSMIF